MEELIKLTKWFLCNERRTFRRALEDDESAFVIAVDFDGVIFDPETSKLIPGAKEALEEIKSLKGKIVIFSGRCGQGGELIRKYTNKDPDAEMRSFLEENKIPYDEIWTGTAKPLADWFVEDKAIPPFQGWDHVLEFVKKQLDSSFESILDREIEEEKEAAKK